uniref:RNA-directed DNA polymerase n=1 Tax=Crassostrea virginica TaxID=6565 RepID=A0A8B8B2F7_CRAVI|nr:uncharacterized protein K02A2.6-like [Crassostrea virginica]
MPGEEDAPNNVIVNPNPIIMNIPFPRALDMKGDLANNWKHFKTVWKNYEVATGLNTKDDKLRCATFLTCMESDALRVFDGLRFQNAEDKEKIEEVIKAMEEFCVGQTNEIYERYNFNKRDQEPNETIDAYVAVLRTLVKTCKYQALEDEMIRDRIVLGVRDNSTRKKLLQEKKLDLQKCIDICRANEKTASQLRNIEEVQYVKSKPHKGRPQPKKDKGHRVQGAYEGKPKYEDDQYSPCKYCGNKHPPIKEKCPAFGAICKNCGKSNHFARTCKTAKMKRKKHVHEVYTDTFDSDDSSSDEFVLSVQHVNEVASRKITAVMNINKQLVEFQLDNGSTVNIMPNHIYTKLSDDLAGNKLRKSNVTLIMFNKSETKTLGKVRFSVRNPRNRKKYNLEFEIVEGKHLHAILGIRAIQAMDLITVNHKEFMSRKEVQEEVVAEIEDISEEMQIKFKSVFEGQGKLDGKLTLEVNQDVKPVKMPARKVPISIKHKLKQELDRLEQLEIIKPVNTPTDWISSLVVAPKSNGRIRLCIDPRPLNQALKRNHYPTPLIEDILPDLGKARIFSVVDARDGFWHVVMDEKSSYLTTFSTPWGRYRWMRMPFGISPAPEEFQRRMEEALEGLDGIKPIHDDILIYGCGDNDKEAEEDHDRKLKALLQRCLERNIKLNKEKMKLKVDSVTYLGFVISKDGLCIDPQKVKAIREMPTPKDKQGVQRLLGMTNFVQRFAPQLSEITAPLRSLLKSETHFRWDEDVHGKAFTDVKTVLSNTPVLRFFDEDKELILQCDASESGLGACLIQEGHPIMYASRSLTETECNYAQIEKELLAVVFGLERFENYTYGRHVEVESDHKPLEIIHRKNLHSAPKRLQRMLLRLQKFDYHVNYKKGTEMYFADTLSRAYLKAQPEDLKEKDPIEVHHVDYREYLPVSEQRIAEIRKATDRDQTSNLLKEVIKNGWPETKAEVSQDIHAYFPFREELVMQNGLIYKGERIVVPTAIRNNLLERIHNSHIGIQGCLRRARESLYWPNMAKDIEQFVSKCEACNTYANEQVKEPMISHRIPKRPWQVIACDLFECQNKDYLITVDYYSDFLEVDRLHSKTGSAIIGKLKSHLARHGIPDTLISDNGPPFNGQEFVEFGRKYEFNHVTSSPNYAQSNGKAENAVKIVKRLIMKSVADHRDPYLALLDLRNTPSQDIGYSPAQRIFGRRTKTLLPVSENLLRPRYAEKVKENLHYRKGRETHYYNKSCKELPELHEGDVVRVRPKGNEKSWKKAIVQGQVDIRSYNIRTEEGREYRKNRRHLRATRESFARDLSPVPRMLDKHPDTTAAKPKEAKQDYPKAASNDTMLKSPVRPNRSILEPNTTLEKPKPVQSDPSTVVTRSGRVVKTPKRYQD